MSAGANVADAARPLRVALVVDCAQAPKYVGEIAAWCLDRDELELVAVIVTGPRAAPPTGMIDAADIWLRRRALAGLRAIDAISVRRHPRDGAQLATVDLSTLGVPVVRVQPTHAEKTQELFFSAEDRAAIGAFRPDILACCGHGEPAGEILAALPRGALVVRFGEPAGASVPLVGFDEVVERKPWTCFSIVQRREDAGGGEILLRGDCSTQGRWLANEVVVHAAVARQLKPLLIRLASERGKGEGVGHRESRAATVSGSGLPSLGRQLRYAAGTAARSASHRIKARFLGADWVWSVSFAWRSWREVDFSAAAEIPNPPGHYYADPFVACVGNQTVVFVEDYDMSLGRGVITALRLDSAGATRLEVVLDEPFHLSFPYIFEHDGTLFMIPESSEARQIRLYRCHGYPLDWRLEAVLMDGVTAVDTMVFSSGQRFWMLTCLDADWYGSFGNEMHLFSAERPDSSTWTPHRSNPILMSADGGRNGGLLREGADLFRIGQTHGFLHYGEAMSINRIERLDDSGYAERRIATVRPNFRPGVCGVHHMHSNGPVTVFDCHRLQRRVR